MITSQFSSQNYWVSRLYLPSRILNTRKHSVSEIESLSFQRWGGGASIQLGSLEKIKLNHWTTPAI
jgi:hypothetical protein